MDERLLSVESIRKESLRVADLLSLRIWRNDARTAASDTSERSESVQFETLVETHYRRVYNLVYRMVNNEADAADLTQEVFIRIYRALPRLRAEGAQNAWIRRIATNVCLDYLRRRRNAPPVASLDVSHAPEFDGPQVWDVPDPSGEPDRLLASQERMELLHSAIQSLPDDYRTVLVLHHIEEMRVEEIAETLEVPPGTIKSRLSRARSALKRKLSPYFTPDHAASSD
jgi:RNA polymerase sigma-70 factor (ECF subfamily)